MAENEVQEIDEMEDELTLLKERADMMGVKYHPSIGLEKLKEKVNEKLAPPKPEQIGIT